MEDLSDFVSDVSFSTRTGNLCPGFLHDFSNPNLPPSCTYLSYLSVRPSARPSYPSVSIYDLFNDAVSKAV
jgi:hypothetical protein